MTDLERFKELYSSLGIELIVNNDLSDNKQTIILSQGQYADQSMTKGFIGYSGFYSQIDFDLDGKFLEQGFWE